MTMPKSTKATAMRTQNMPSRSPLAPLAMTARMESEIVLVTRVPPIATSTASSRVTPSLLAVG